MSKQKKLILALAVILFLAIVGLAIYKTAGNDKPAARENNLVGADRDEHDCLASAGYSWCQAENKCLRVFEEFCPDSLTKLVASIKQASGVELAGAEKKEFNWIAADGNATADIKISGLIYSVQSISREDYNKIEKYLNDNFGGDNSNMADGVEGGLRGYYIDYSVCALSFHYGEMRPKPEGPIEPANDQVKVTLACGYFNKNNSDGLAAAKRVRQILADKYKKAIDQVFVRVTKNDQTHAAGSIYFGQGGEGGLFLAVKNAEDWQVVFDGNGSVDCSGLRGQYGFSDYILSPQFCDAQTAGGFKNSQIEKAVTDYLLSQKIFSWQTAAGSRNFCVIDNLNPSGELFPLYIWARCGEFGLEKGQLKELSGTSLPVKINYPNELSFYDQKKFSYEIPRDGSFNGPDIERIFPAEVQKRLSGLDKEILNQKIKALAQAEFSAK